LFFVPHFACDGSGILGEGGAKTREQHGEEHQ
jgi:hypothetical protein